MTLSRRDFLARSALIGCSAAASPLLTPVTFAAAPWDGRLVVIILRGGVDGLDMVQPYGDPDLAAARRSLSVGPARGASDLDGFFALHEALGPLMPLWSAGELGFVHAVSTPYRDKRSHFDGQDLLEAGTAGLAGVRDGWLNRMLQALPGVERKTAYAIGHGELKLLAGAARFSNWSPDADLVLSAQAMKLMELVMEDDPVMAAAFAEAVALSDDGDLLANDMAATGDMAGGEDMMAMPARGRGAEHVKIAEFAAEQLRGDTRVAAFSINGWDTHNRQAQVLPRGLRRLSETILALRDGMGADAWSRTAVLAMTEFGRTVRENGSGGTDHGTGGAMLLAGGAVRGGTVHGTWPGLSEAALYDRRDLMPTADLRGQAAWIMRGLTGLDRATLESAVFPGLDMGAEARLLR